MAEINLTQAEADRLIAIQKIKVSDTPWEYPVQGSGISIPLVSIDKKENFLLDISRGRIDLIKGRYQTRARQVVILVRIDFGGAPHRNPDGKEVASPHLHVYREGYGDKWATLIPKDLFKNISDRSQLLEDFMEYCNIIQRPNIVHGLFI
ncbi:MAG: hypothetical protein C0417_11630 [Chlorobiaceae bacterium]|nr:hypothetical protein [Chlorobiaceae bacterium]